jgi:hypothetical protein
MILVLQGHRCRLRLEHILDLQVRTMFGGQVVDV